MRQFFKVEKLLTKFFSYEKDNRYNHLALGIVGGLGHIVFWLYWTYIDPQKYESAILRSIGFLICLGLVSTPYWKASFRAFISPYWIFAVIYNLPFFFTVSLIRNSFFDMWFVAEATMIFTVMLFLTDLIKSTLIILIGVALAVLFCHITAPETVYFDHRILRHVPVYLLTFSASYIFSFSNSKGFALSQEARDLQKIEIMKSLAGSIAHEIRNPLNTINLIGGQIGGLLPQISDKSSKQDDREVLLDTKKQLVNLTSKISEAIKGANNIINVILSDLSDKPIDPSDFSYLNPSKILSEIIEKYGYKDEAEKKKVKLDQSLQIEYESVNSFVFKAVPDRLTFIIYNLLKNALYYLKDYPNSIVTVGVEKKNFEGLNYNVIYIQDTGPGIPKDAISKLFEDFYTSGKKDGTGLGLSFCKRNMRAFGGDIICESELGKWTKFSLLFPEISEEELKNVVSQSESKKKRILIVDDEKTNILIEKNILEKNLNIICDIAENGLEAVKLFKENIDEYKCILMDLEMPIMDGFKATSEIRKLESNIPIIAYSSLQNAQAEASKAGANEYLVKPVKKELLIKTISKWIDAKYNPLSNKSSEEIKAILQNKRVLLADDEGTNRLMLAKYIGNFGAIVDKVEDGQGVIDKFKESTSSNNPYDLIISDINMPIITGNEAAKEIRKYERERSLKSIPIIAFTGDSDMSKLQVLFNSGMSDYLVKGGDNEYMLRVLGFWMHFKEDYLNHHL